MSRNDIRIVDNSGKSANPVRKFTVPAASSAILAGEPVQIRTTISGDQTIGFYPIVLSDNQAAGAFYFLGIAAKDGTHTSSADGTVDVYLDLPGTIYAASPKTAGVANSSEDIDAKQFYRMAIDLTSSRFTLDDTTTDATTAPFIVVGGNADNDELHFVAAEGVTWRFWGKQGTI